MPFRFYFLFVYLLLSASQGYEEKPIYGYVFMSVKGALCNEGTQLVFHRGLDSFPVHTVLSKNMGRTFYKSDLLHLRVGKYSIVQPKSLRSCKDEHAYNLCLSGKSCVSFTSESGFLTFDFELQPNGNLRALYEEYSMDDSHWRQLPLPPQSPQWMTEPCRDCVKVVSLAMRRETSYYRQSFSSQSELGIIAIDSIVPYSFYLNGKQVMMYTNRTSVQYYVISTAPHNELGLILYKNDDEETVNPITIRLYKNAMDCLLPDEYYLWFYRVSTGTEEYLIVHDNEVIEKTNNPYLYICLPKGKYSIYMESKDVVYNHVFPRIKVFLRFYKEYIQIEEFILTSSMHNFLMYLNHWIVPRLYYSDMHYLIDQGVPVDWYRKEESEWSVLDPNHLPEVNSRFELFYTQFTFSGRVVYTSYYMHIMGIEGAVVYLNGKEVFRRCLQDAFISNTTMPTRPCTVSEKWIKVTRTIDFIHDGLNTMHIGIVHSSPLHAPTSFDIALGSIRENKTMSFFSFYSATPDLFDYDLHTAAEVDGKGGIGNFSISFINEMFAMNHYCIVRDKKDPNQDPKDWMLWGVTETGESVLIDQRTSVYMQPNFYDLCFYLWNETRLFSGYTLGVTKNRCDNTITTVYSMSQWNLFIFNKGKISVRVLRASSNVRTFHGTEYPYNEASSPHYRDFFIYPPLPDGLALNSYSGSIIGHCDRNTKLFFTIGAINEYQEKSEKDMLLECFECSASNIWFEVTVYSDYCGGNAAYSLVNLSTGTMHKGKDEFSIYSTSTVSFCVGKGFYNIYMNEKNGQPWMNTYLVITSRDRILLEESLPSNKGFLAYAFNPTFSIEEETYQWRYHVDSTSVPQEWLSNEYMTLGWEKGVSGKLHPATAITQFYVGFFYIKSEITYSMVEISVNVRAGIIVYINGEEIHRHNLPKGTITHETRATGEESEPITLEVSELVQHNVVKLDKNLLAFELHSYQSQEVVNSFAASVIFIPSSSRRSIIGKGACTPDGVPSGICQYLYDTNIHTKFLTKGKCEGVEMTWSFPEHHYEPITHYAIQNSDNCNTYHPSGWNISGWDGEQWITLQSTERQFFNSFYEKKAYMVYNTRLFNKYRVHVTECKNPSISSTCEGVAFQLSTFYLFTEYIEHICRAYDGYQTVLDKEISKKACPALYEGYLSRLCNNGVFGREENHCVPVAPSGKMYAVKVFDLPTNRYSSIPAPEIVGAELSFSCVPPLPQGLHFEEGTGEIRGIPTHSQTATLYCIMVANRGGNATDFVAITITNSRLSFIVTISLVSVVVVAYFVFLIITKSCCKKIRPTYYSTEVYSLVN